jgi:hypothetical protein
MRRPAGKAAAIGVWARGGGDELVEQRLHRRRARSRRRERLDA